MSRCNKCYKSYIFSKVVILVRLLTSQAKAGRFASRYKRWSRTPLRAKIEAGDIQK